MKSPPFIVSTFASLSLWAAPLVGAFASETGDSKADVASLKPQELVQFEAQPAKVRSIISKALELTKKDLGYRFGSCDPDQGGMDCSGTVYHILRSQGFDPPRSSHSIYGWIRESGNLTRVREAENLKDRQLFELQPGDLLFWEGTYDVGERVPPVSHVMIFLGYQEKDGKPVAMGASSGRYYDGKARHGVSVFDFKLPRKGSRSKFIAYGPVPGVDDEGKQQKSRVTK